MLNLVKSAAVENPWEEIYGRGEQLNRYPHDEVVSFTFRRWGADAKGRHGLDVGCGSGVHAGFLAGLGAHATAFDYSSAAIQHASKLFPNERIKYLVSDFEGFDGGDDRYDLVVDRCSSTQSSPGTIHRLYQNLKKNLKPGAELFWQGFQYNNSGRDSGRLQEDGSWTDFTDGVFKGLGQTVFLKEEELPEVFAGYTFKAVRKTHNIYTQTGYDNSGWVLEMVYEG